MKEKKPEEKTWNINYVPEDMRKVAEECFLVSHWSASAVNSHNRNPFAFARSRIYKIYRPNKSVSSACGSGYDLALQQFFQSIKDGKGELGLSEMLDFATYSIRSIKKHEWKKTAKSPEEMEIEAIKKATFSLTSFLSESKKYTSIIKEVLHIDQSFEVLVSVSGQPIPLPLIFRPDLIFINQDDELCILDHKCKGRFTPVDECIFSYGNQAITYILGVEKLIELGHFNDLLKKYPKIKNGIKDFYFFENKNSKNRDGSDQIVPIQMPDLKKTRSMIESILYEGVKKLYEAVSDPEHVFVINPYDNFENKAEMLDDWIAIQTLQVDAFEIPTAKKELMEKRQKKIRDASLQNLPAKVIKNFKDYSQNFITLSNMENKTPEDRIEMRLQTLGIIARVKKTVIGSSVTTYLLEVPAGMSVKRLQSSGLDIAVALGAENVYIPKSLYRDGVSSYVQVQVNNNEDQQVVATPSCSGLLIPIGIDNFGETVYWDMSNHSSPHAMIAGATGSGKSVCLDSIMRSLEGKGEIIILDPKYEFSNSINDIKGIEDQIAMLVMEMEDRVKARQRKETFIIFDELADCLMSGSKQLHKDLQLLLQKGRSCGMHIIGATQRCSTKILSGDLLVNMPVRICFRVPKAIDSQVILGESGGEKLRGMGDGLILSPDHTEPHRFQGFYK